MQEERRRIVSEMGVCTPEMPSVESYYIWSDGTKTKQQPQVRDALNEISQGLNLTICLAKARCITLGIIS